MIFGRTDLTAYAIPLISLIAFVTDIATGRIFNWLTAPALVAGVVFSGIIGGWPGVGGALAGVAAAFALFGWMFWTRAIGGGDVKLLMALGAWGGPRYVVEVALLSVLLGGVMAAAILCFKGRMGDFARRMYRFLLTVFVKELEVEAPRIDRKSTMPFGIPIAIAAVIVLFLHPLESLGFRLWQ